MADIQLLTIFQHLAPGKIEPVAVFEPKTQRQPVGHINQVLIFNDSAGLFGFQAVVTARQICTRVVDPVVFGFRSSAARGKIAVSQRAQCFAQFFLFRFEVVVDQPPGAQFFRLRHSVCQIQQELTDFLRIS